MLAMTACQLKEISPTHRHREQAHSHKGSAMFIETVYGTGSNVGASLLAMEACQLKEILLTLRYREQARSYRGFVVFTDILFTANLVGVSLLAIAQYQSKQIPTDSALPKTTLTQPFPGSELYWCSNFRTPICVHKSCSGIC
ncbi:MAG: hypothetical protein ABWY28_07335 [Pseudomonas prosekii]